tara:strand:- start:1420 stop:2013 length:594 start_codon:yes stop_codon:yes gene_type:complete
MKKVIKLTESDLQRIVKRVIKEEGEPTEDSGSLGGALGAFNAVTKMGKMKVEERLKEIKKIVKISESFFNTILNLHNLNSKNNGAINYFKRFGNEAQNEFSSFEREPNMEKFKNPILSSTFTKLIREISNLYKEKYKNTNNRGAASFFWNESTKIVEDIKDALSAIKDGKKNLKQLRVFNPNLTSELQKFMSEVPLD